MANDQKVHHHQDGRPYATDAAALRHFLRGYFHQDLTDEYGTPANAAARFAAEAAQEEVAAVRRAWEAALAAHVGDLPGLNAHLAELGSAWLFSDESELAPVSAAFAFAKP